MASRAQLWKNIKDGFHFDHESMFDILIQDDFFPTTDVTRNLFLIAINLIDSKFYRYKYFVFEHLTVPQKMTIKYMVRYFNKKMQDLDFEPDDHFGNLKTRKEQNLTHQQGALLVYKWLWTLYCL